MSNLLSKTIAESDLRKLIQHALTGQDEHIPRERLVRTLEFIVCNHDSRKFYLGLLNEIAASEKLYSRSPLTNEIIGLILNERFSNVENRILSQIAGSYYAISQLAFEVSESEPEAWNAVFEELGRHILGATVSLPTKADQAADANFALALGDHDEHPVGPDDVSEYESDEDDDDDLSSLRK